MDFLEQKLEYYDQNQLQVNLKQMKQIVFEPKQLRKLIDSNRRENKEVDLGKEILRRVSSAHKLNKSN